MNGPKCHFRRGRAAFRRVVSGASDRDPAALREMERLGLRPGVQVWVEPGPRGASLLGKAGGNSHGIRLNQTLADALSVLQPAD